MNPVCQLNDYNFTKLSIEWVPAGNGGEFVINNLATRFSYDVYKNPDNELEYLMRFWAAFHEETEDKERVGYQITSEIFGNFTLDESVEEEQCPSLIRHNGVSILLGLLRAQIGINTGSFYGSKLIIPTIMPQEIVAEVEKIKANAQKTAKKKAVKRVAKKVAKKRLAKSK